jgi:hypothetical protein
LSRARYWVKAAENTYRKARLGGVSLWVLYNSTAFTPQITSLVQDCFEDVVELAIEERNGVLTRVIRIPQMERRPVSGKWSRLSPL